MKKLSIIQIISSAVWGGREQHVKDLTKGLKANGHDVIIITRNHPIIMDHYREDADVIPLPLRNIVDVHSIRVLVSLIKQHQIDVIHTHTGRDAWIALLATKIAGRGKVFNTRHTVSRVKNDLVHRWYYQNLEKVICVSELVRKEFLKACSVIKPERAVVVYNGVDTKKLMAGSGEQIRSKLGLQDHCLIGYAGRISPEKGLEYLIEAAFYLKNKQHNIKIIIAGEAKEDYLQFLKEKIIELELQSEVIFFGFSKNIADFMNAIDILVLPCICPEAFGLVLCEAMVCSKVVITTTSGAQGELITSGADGFLVAAGSGQGIGDVVERIIQDSEYGHGIGENGKHKVLSCFTLEQMVENMEHYYVGE